MQLHLTTHIGYGEKMTNDELFTEVFGTGDCTNVEFFGKKDGIEGIRCFIYHLDGIVSSDASKVFVNPFDAFNSAYGFLMVDKSPEDVDKTVLNVTGKGLTSASTIFVQTPNGDNSSVEKYIHEAIKEKPCYDVKISDG